MSYTVLARKWRPQNFTELQGQEHVSRALINALEQERLHHAYLFTGTRGVGKTTIARILSKCLNCETNGITPNPCGECGSCVEITEGRFVDLIEVDAASRTKVDDTRELLENVQYRPTKGRYKVYLIDEVHMLSTSSFNALLKTLEEPPPHVIFLLATTDPQKLPVTVLSRCLQFHLKHMPAELISNHLQYLLGQEGIEFEAPALQLIADSADGSMRDALSLLDQAIVYGQQAVREDEVRTMLGTISHQFIADLLDALGNHSAEQAMTAVANMSQYSVDFGAVIKELLTALQQIAVHQAVGTSEHSDAELIAKYAEQIMPADCQVFYQMGLNARRDIAYAPSPRQALEMALLQMLLFSVENTGAATQPAKKKVATKSKSGAPDPSKPAPQSAPDESKSTAIPVGTPTSPEIKLRQADGKIEPETLAAQQDNSNEAPTASDVSSDQAQVAERNSNNPNIDGSTLEQRKPKPALGDTNANENENESAAENSEHDDAIAQQMAAYDSMLGDDSQDDDEQQDSATALENTASSAPADENDPQDQSSLASLHDALGIDAEHRRSSSSQESTEKANLDSAKSQELGAVDKTDHRPAVSENKAELLEQPSSHESEPEDLRGQSEAQRSAVESIPSGKSESSAAEQEPSTNLTPETAMVKPQPVAGSDGESDNLEVFGQSWADFSASLKIASTARQVVDNSLPQLKSDSEILLHYDPQFEAMVSDNTTRVIEQAMTDVVGRSIKVLLVATTPEGETPRLRRQRHTAERLEKAKQDILSSNLVQRLQNELGASLDESTVRATDTGT